MQVVGHTTSRWLVVVGTEPLCRVEVRGPLRLPATVAGRSLHDAIGGWAGLHDVLRNRTGAAIGVRAWIDDAEAPRELTALARCANVTRDAHSVSLWFGTDRDVDEERSVDQSLGDHLLLGDGSVVALMFDLAHLDDTEFRALLGESPRA